jgi:hypothetical protein
VDLLRNNQLPLSGNVDQWIRTWGEAVSQFGFFNVNVVNSGNPQAEREITANYSYGRQLGRILDMLAPLVEERAADPKKKVDPKALDDFRKMVKDIKDFKARSVEDIVHQVEQWDKASPTFATNLNRLLTQLSELKRPEA